MKSYILLFILLIILPGCEIFVIGKPDGKKQTERTEIDRFTPRGTLMLFKAELDSNNIPAAARMLADSTGRKLPALSQYEMYNEMRRLKNLIGNKVFTNIEEDSISPYHTNIKIEVDSFKSVGFNLAKIEKYWYITGFK